MSSFALGWNSSLPSHCALLIRASEPSGRAVASDSCAEPYRPTPLPATNFNPASSFFANRGTVALAPAPPPVRESLNAPAAVGAVAAGASVQERAGPTSVTEPAVPAVPVLAAGLTTAQG